MAGGKRGDEALAHSIDSCNLAHYWNVEALYVYTGFRPILLTHHAHENVYTVSLKINPGGRTSVGHATFKARPLRKSNKGMIPGMPYYHSHPLQQYSHVLQSLGHIPPTLKSIDSLQSRTPASS